MPYSGASLAASALYAAGAVAASSAVGSKDETPDGPPTFESPAFAPIHDEFLKRARIESWSDPLQLPAEAFSSVDARVAQDRLVEALVAEFRDAPLACINEPVLCRLLPLWIPALVRAELDAGYLILVRNPLEVAREFRQSGSDRPVDPQLGWLRCALEAEAHTRDFRRVFVSHDRFVDDWRVELDRIAHALDVAWPRRRSEIAYALDPIVADYQGDHRIAPASLAQRSDVPEWVVSTYTALQEATGCATEPAHLLGALDRIRAALDEADKAFEPALVAERLGRTVLQARLSEREIHVRSLDLLVTASRSEAAEAQAQATDLLSQLKALQVEADESGWHGQLRVGQIVELERQLQDLKRRHALAEAQISERTSQNVALTQDLESVRDHLERQSLAVIEAHDEASVLRKELAVVRAACDRESALSIATQEEAAALRDRLSRVEARAAELSSQAAQLSETIENLHVAAEAARTDLEQRDRALTDLRAELAIEQGFAARSSELEKQLAERDEKIEELGHFLEHARSEANVFRERAASLQASLDAQASQNEERLSNLRGERVSEVQRVRDFEERLSRAEASLRERNELLDEARTELEAQRAEVAAARRTLSHREAELDEMRVALAYQARHTEQELELARSELTLRSQELGKSQTALRTAEARAAALATKSSLLAAELALNVEERAESRPNDGGPEAQR